MKFLKAMWSFLAMLFIGLQVSAQILNPVKWESEALRTDENTFQMIFTATIDDGWHLYSQNLPDVFPRPEPTEFYFDTLRNVSLEGNTLEGESEHEYDPNFEMELNYFSHKAVFTQMVKITADKGIVKGAVGFMTCDDSRCLPPDYFDFEFTLDNNMPIKKAITISGSVPAHQEEVSIEKTEETDETGLVGIFFIGFGLGLAALFTPCVFPMIPMTVSFFTKQSKSKAAGIKNSLIYGGFIVFIYTGLGLILTAVFGVDVMNAISTDPYFNLFLFLLLVVFGMSFLGFFEISLPSSWVNKMDSKADKGGIVGIFFMAATLALVSFSCTGGLIGGALAGATQGQFMTPVTIMLGFSIALALPFGLFAAFPGWMNTLPQSGGWLTTVKVFLGLLEIGFALKFLSNADLVLQLGLLKREMFIAVWVIISGLIAAYMFGYIQFPHDTKPKFINMPRFLVGLLFSVLTLYMIPGVFGAQLQLISGFPPPMSYSEAYVNNPESGHGGVEAHYSDLETGIAAAKKEGKPVLLDFTGWACVNCRKMEESVWPHPKVSKMLRDDVVLISLYVDERIKLPKDQHRVEEYGGKEFKIKTVGNKWSYFQAVNFNVNAQPFYAFIDYDQKPYGETADYDSDPEVFIDFLEKGIKEFKAAKH